MAARNPRTTAGSATLKPNNTTGKGKELRILPVAGSSLMRIAFYPGGEVPDVWKGALFTSVREAQKEIDRYLK